MKKHTIAVVDDNPGVRKSLTRLLSASGYHVEPFASAKEFQIAARTSQATCLVVDFNLGDVSGLELARRLVAAGFDFPIIFMTSSDDDTVRRQCMEFGCVAFLHKPFPEVRLTEAIAKAISVATNGSPVAARWELEGFEFGNCSCQYACPCHFNALPTHGHCLCVFGYHIVKGHHGNTNLDGVKVAVIARFPGPIYEGRGELVTIIDERADDAQRDALLRILTGEDAAPGTFFHIFASTMERVHPPVFTAVDFEVDVDRRRAKLIVPGHVQAVGEPIVNPATGTEQQLRIDTPKGTHFREAEIGRGWTVSEEPISFDLTDSYGRFVRLHLNHGVIG
jgi:CheY-like chemotaxis protein